MTGYDLYRNGAKLVTNVTNLNFRDTRVQPGTQYRYRVDARDNATPPNVSSKSNWASVTTPAVDAIAPRAPGNLTAQANSPTEVLLRWAASTDRGGGVVTGYDLYRNGAKLVTNVTNLNFRDTRVQPGTQYRYRVDARDNATPPNVSSKSNWASVTTPAVDAIAPRAPGNLTAQANSPTEVLLRWAASTDRGGGVVTGYDLYRNGAKLVTNVTNLNFRDTRVQPGTQYRYRVDARDNATPPNVSSKSNWASVTTPAVDAIAPRAPGNLTAQANSPTEVLLRWAASTDRGRRRRDWL